MIPAGPCAPSLTGVDWGPRWRRSDATDSGRFEQPIVTEIVPAGAFYPAEEYHQKFYLKSPDQYVAYRAVCRRDEPVRTE